MADTETKEISEDPDGWTVQDPWQEAPEADLALEPQQFLPEQLPDPEGAQNALVPPQQIPEGQISDEAVDHPNGPEPDELLNLGMIDELPERETVETSNTLDELGDGWTVQNPDWEAPEAETEAEGEEGEEVDLSTMTKAEIQAWADENGYEVNQNTMNKDEMIEAIIG